MSTWDEIKSQLDNQKQEQFNTALGYQRKPKHPSDPDYNFKDELANSFRPKNYADRFNDYMNQRVSARMSATRSSSADPDLAALDRREAEARQGLNKVDQDALTELRQEYERHNVDPKRQRWSAIASAATDAISGIAGMIGVANGAVHPASLSSTPSASKVTSDYYDSERKKRQEALAKLHDADQRRYKQILADVEADRKRHYERIKREQEQKKQAHLESMYPYQLAEAQAKAESAGYNAQYNKARADAYPAYSQSQIARNNRSGTGSSRSTGLNKSRQSGLNMRTVSY